MPKPHQFDHKAFIVRPGSSVDLDRISTDADDEFKKSEAKRALAQDIESLSDAQRLLWADGSRAVLIILQALDAAGKDGTIRHVMSGVNPQGVAVHGFKAPNDEEVLHHFLWRPTRYLPPKGFISIFNRSYYEEVLIVRVHPEFLERQRLPEEPSGEALWQSRFAAINAYEDQLVRSGTMVLKFYLHLSKAEQKQRFLDRIDEPDKNWKFNEADVRERGYWDDYRRAYRDVFEKTSTDAAPWYIIPADDKWYARAVVADIIAAQIESLGLQPPSVSEARRAELRRAREGLMTEGR